METADLTTATDMELTYHGYERARLLRMLHTGLETVKRQAEVKESIICDLERDLDLINAELNNRNYHDIGHAREQFECKAVDGHKVLLADDELDPRVRAFRDEGVL